MPDYTYKLTNGKTLTLSGDTPPSDEEVESIARENKVSLALAETPKPTSVKTEPVKPVPKEQGMLGRMWSAISEPLTEAPSRFADTVSRAIDTRSLDQSPLMARIKGFAAGATEGLGDVVSDLTSPINLATMLATGGSSTAAKMGYGGASRMLDIGSRIAGAPVVAHGAGEVLSPDSSLADRGMGLAEIAGGLAGMKGRPTLDDGPIVTKQVGKGTTVKASAKAVEQVMPEILESELTGVDRAVDASGGRRQAYDPKAHMERLKQERMSKIADRPEGTIYNWDTGQIEPDPNWNPTTKTSARTPEEVASLPTNTIQPNVLISADKATPDAIKKIKAEGYEFAGVNDQGAFRFKKVNKPTEQPVLEGEIGSSRPTRQVMGPETDAKKPSMIGEAMNFPRTVMASIDMSAPLRQGIGLVHKKEFWKALPQMVKAWGSEAAFDGIQQSIAEKPLFKRRIDKMGKEIPSFAEDAGLKLTDLTDVTKREESMMSTWAEKIPGVRPSNRAYTAFLNKLRADTFESLVNQGEVFGADGKKNLPLARSLADFVNTATGRGSLGKLESSAVALNNAFFAPRLIASRLKMLNPAYYIMANPQVRKEALKSLFAIAGTGTAVGQLAKMGGGTVESDPTSSDFGKIKIGNTRIDPFAGFQQYIVAANRLVQGRTKSSTTGQEYNLGEKFGRPTRLDVVGRFAESKLTPVLSFATGILRGKDFTGQPFNIPEEVASRFTPIFIQDLKQLVTENPNLLPTDSEAYKELHAENLPFAVPAFFGMGVQQYDSR